MKKSSLVFITMVFIVSCSTDDARQATLMPGAKPATRYHLNTGTQKPNPTDAQIRLIKAQTAAKARLAEIEARKAERLKKLETQRAMTVAQLEAEKTQKVKALELEQTKNTNTAQTQIATTKAQTDVAIEKEQLGFYRQLTIAAVIVILLLMLLAYFLYRHRQSLKLKIHEDGLRHQAYLEASRQHHEKVTKMLEIIADESTDKGLKKELTRLLKDTEEKPSVLLEHKG
jgi:hypothetical protein